VPTTIVHGQMRPGEGMPRSRPSARQGTFVGEVVVLAPSANVLATLRGASAPYPAAFTSRPRLARIEYEGAILPQLFLRSGTILRANRVAGSINAVGRRFQLFRISNLELVAHICPRWNRLEHWFELAEAFRSAA